RDHAGLARQRGAVDDPLQPLGAGPGRARRGDRGAAHAAAGRAGRDAHLAHPPRTGPVTEEGNQMLTVTDLGQEFALQDGRVVKALDDVGFTIERGKFYTLLGPSGCGKTTTLRSIAGLEHPDRGRIVIDGTPVFDSARQILVPSNRRRIGMVFQSYAIWPHMDVFENVAFPLRVGNQRHREADIAERVRRTLATVHLEGFEHRPATRLSGGQQQRLALARALVIEPQLLLLDEPLSNLDAKLRESMRLELRRIQSELGITTVYVTHDQTEALAMSDTIAVMQNGRIVQQGDPQSIYSRPATRFVAE